jgi:hypothetical protein
MGRLSTGLLVAVLLGACLAGCGGGGESSTAVSASSQGTAAPAHEATAAKEAQTSSGQKPEKKKSTSTHPLPPPTPGSKAAAPGVPTSKEGDNSIQTYGVEASSAQRAQASAFVQGYLNARAAGSWAKVCAQLAAKPRAEQSRFAKGASCAAAMASFAKEASGAVLREEARIEVLSLRIGPRFAFLIYRRPDQSVWATALAREGGGWRVLSVTPAPLQ